MIIRLHICLNMFYILHTSIHIWCSYLYIIYIYIRYCTLNVYYCVHFSHICIIILYINLSTYIELHDSVAPLAHSHTHSSNYILTYINVSTNLWISMSECLHLHNTQTIIHAHVRTYFLSMIHVHNMPLGCELHINYADLLPAIFCLTSPRVPASEETFMHHGPPG